MPENNGVAKTGNALLMQGGSVVTKYALYVAFVEAVQLVAELTCYFNRALFFEHGLYFLHSKTC